ncbi:MAG: c-type cytochrome [Planctomycetes bacterium]|nr:c-type cytochrome [Planctomycetota bacterium]
MRFYGTIASLFVLLALAVGLPLVFRGRGRYPEELRQHVPVADAERGRTLIREYGCGACHTVSGVPNATGRVGPRLHEIQEKAYIAGVLPNSPQHLIYWIRNPRAAAPRTAMPDLNVSERDARDIAAYLYSIP